jgi:Protein of unknown function (DUF723)
MTQYRETTDQREILKAKIDSKFGDRFLNFKDVVFASTSLPITVTCPAHGEFSAMPTDILKYRGNKTPCCPDCLNRKKSVQQLIKEAESNRLIRERYELHMAQMQVRDTFLKNRRSAEPKPKPTYSQGVRYLTRAMKEYLDAYWVNYPDKFTFQDDLETVTLIYPDKGPTSVTIQDIKDAMCRTNDRELPGYTFNQREYVENILDGVEPQTHPDWSPCLRYRFRGAALNQASLNARFPGYKYTGITHIYVPKV